MTAMAGASGVRSWLQSQGWMFLTAERLRRTTIGLFVVATLISTVGLSGSSRPAHGTVSAAAHSQAASAVSR
jgi:hypothetical protein